MFLVGYTCRPQTFHSVREREKKIPMIIEPNDPSTVLSSHRIDSFRTKIITFTLLLRFTIDIIIYGS